MPFHDLNVRYTPNHADLSHTLAFHAELGYTVVAIALEVTGKLPAEPHSVPLSDISRPKSLTLLTRLNLTISDATQNHRVNSLIPHYNLLALRPTNEKSFQLCCTSLECDIISLPLHERLPFLLKFKTISAAFQRGIRFEICYSPGIGGSSDARRNLISGAASLIRATRGRGIVISSEARNALGVRGPWDVVNLAQVWGLGQERGKEAVCEEAGKVVKLAGLKRTSFRGVVDVVDGGAEDVTAKEKEKPKDAAKEKSARPMNKADVNTPQRDDQVRESAQKEVVVPNSAKRKASNASMTGPSQLAAGDGKPVSKREQKRQVKKARFEAKMGTSNPQNVTKQNNFDIKHEALSKKKG